MFGFFSKKEKKSTKSGRQAISGKRPVVLVIMDGLGLSDQVDGNAVRMAKTPFLDTVWTKAQKTKLHASGVHVGLPELEPGNSEVGHLNIGAGRVVYQSLPRINDSIRNGTFYKNPVLSEAFETVKARGTNLHLIGILSNGGVHGHIEHLKALLEISKQHDVDPYLHCFLDGRDTGLTAGKAFLNEIMSKCGELGVGRIASVGGRYYGMDRDKRWDRTQVAYDSIVGIAENTTTDPISYVQVAYDNDENDQIMTPVTVVDDIGAPVGAVQSGDVVVFYNFREDRARQLTKAFVVENFEYIEQVPGLDNLHFVTMTGYEDGLDTKVIFAPEKIPDGLAKVLEQNRVKQLHISETEKYMHVSYFFNGGIEAPHNGEDLFNIPSPKVFDYSETPQMSAQIITDEIVYRLKRHEKFQYGFMVANLANPDMLGHTGNIGKAIEAVEFTDKCVATITEKTLEIGGVVILIADHGNCEKMINPSDGSINTYHTNNPVPMIVISDSTQTQLEAGERLVRIGDGVDVHTTGMLADVAPTVLGIMGLDIPDSMTGINLMDVM